MRKIIFSLMICVGLFNFVALQAQDTRYAGIWFDASSGNVIRNGVNNNGVFAGNEFWYGAWYSHTFAAVPWLSIGLGISSVFYQYGSYLTSDGSIVTTSGSGPSDGIYMGLNNWYLGGTSFASGNDENPKVELSSTIDGRHFGLNGLVFNLTIDTRTFVVFQTSYNMALPLGSLKFAGAVEFYANPILVFSEYEDVGEFGLQDDYTHSVLDVFHLSVAYNVNFAKHFSFTTTFQARFNGAGGLDNSDLVDGVGNAFSGAYDYYQVKAWQENFLAGLDLRLESKLNFNMNGFDIWAGIRLDFENICPDGEVTVNLAGIGPKTIEYTDELGYALSLKAGVSFMLNLSRL